MKKIILVMTVVMVSLTACVDDYDIPDVTFIGYELGEEAYNSVVNAMSAKEIANAVNIWLTTPEGDERYKVEDTYFPNNRVRTIGKDTISIMGISVVYLNVTETNDTVWTVLPAQNSLLTDIVYYVNLKTDDSTIVNGIDVYGDTIVHLESSQTVHPNKIIITGYGKGIMISQCKYFNNISFNINKGLTCNSFPRPVSWDSFVQSPILSGIIDVFVYQFDQLIEEDQTKVNFNGSNVEITYRNTTSLYNSYGNYNRYYY